MKKQVGVAGQIVLGVIVGNVLDKGLDFVLKKVKNVAKKKAEKAQN